MPKPVEDHLHMRFVRDDKRRSGFRISVTTPSKVINITSEEELLAQLDHYNRPFLRLLVPNSQTARRNHVEKVRPALRYYCRKFNVPIPGWLKDDDRYLKMPDKEKLSMFGTAKLHVHEFQRAVTPDVSVDNE